MTLHLPSFAEKVRRCREMFGQSIDDLSRATGISAPELAALEGAGRTPTGDEVLILADHFLCDFKFFISNEQTTPIERTEKLFRAYSTARVPVLRPSKINPVRVSPRCRITWWNGSITGRG